VYPAWTGLYDGRRYNAWRTWAEVLPADAAVTAPGWSRRADVAGSYKRVKHGASLVALGDRLYLFVGNNTVDFLSYDMTADAWQWLDSVPFSAAGRARRVNRGACAATDGNDIYFIKGNNTYEFWRWEPFSGRWEELAQPVLAKRIKAGTMAYDGEDGLYLIPGGSGNEWRVFDLADRAWSTPAPETLPGLKWKKGSVMVAYGDWLYALRGGSKTNELYRLDAGLPVPSWERRADLPVYGIGGRRKKLKDGASALAVGDRIYVLKGGNTYEFWCYFPERDSWAQLEDVGQPSGMPLKRVKSGGALAYSPAAGGIFATVGNNTNEFWLYVPGRDYFGDGPAGRESKGTPPALLSVVPNPARGVASVRSPAPTEAKLRVFDAAGRCVANVPRGRDGWAVDASRLAAGVYLLQTEGGSTNSRLVVSH
jgi:hypothetical protein